MASTPEEFAAFEASYQFKTQPYAHQGFAGVLKNWKEDYWAYLLEMGCGKSKILIDNMCLLYRAGWIKSAIIVAPKGVYRNWAIKEIPAHMPDAAVKAARIHVWRGGHTKTEQAQLDWLTNDDGKQLRILIINTEGITRSGKSGDWLAKLVEMPCLLAVDEASICKSPTSDRSQILANLGKSCEYRRIMTGTPVTRSPLDLWAQFQILKDGALGHDNYYSFRGEFAVMQKKVWGRQITKQDKKKNSAMRVVGYRHIDRLSRKVAACASVIRKEDCLDLPPKVYLERDSQLTPEQITNYNDLLQFCTAEIAAGKFTTTTTVITQLLRLHQIVCGHSMDDQGQIHQIPTNRPEEVIQMMEEQDGQTIHWCNFRNDVDLMMEALTKAGRRPVRFDGSTSDKDRQEAIRRFQDDVPPHERADDFVGTPQAGGYGITLTRARHVSYYSNTFDLEKRLQSEDRAHRIGQMFSIDITDFIARGTVEERIVKALQKKIDLSNLIMDGPARVRELFGEKVKA